MTIEMSQNELIQRLEGLVEKHPENQKYHALLGEQYLKINDLSNAHMEFRKAIEIDPDNPDCARAYAGRGQLYRVQLLFNEALEDLNKAKKFFGLLPNSIRDIVETEINIAEMELRKREEEKNQLSAPKVQIPHLKSGGANETSWHYYQANSNLGQTDPQRIFFGQLILFMEGQLDSAPTAAANSGSQLYWSAFAQCSKALNKEKQFGLTSSVKILYIQAKNSLEELLEQYALSKKKPPSIIHYVLATTHFKLENYPKALEHVTSAIELNPDGDATYYRFRALLNQDMGMDEDAKRDEYAALKIDPNPEYYRMVISAYNEVNHCIEFYDQAKTDNTDYQPDDTIYGSLANLGVDLVPKRGDDLDPIEVLYAKRAMLCGILGRTDDEKLADSLRDAELAMSNLPKEHPLFLKVLIGRAQVYFYMKSYDLALNDLEEALEMAPGNEDIIIMLANVEKAMEDTTK